MVLELISQRRAQVLQAVTSLRELRPGPTGNARRIQPSARERLRGRFPACLIERCSVKAGMGNNHLVFDKRPQDWEQLSETRRTGGLILVDTVNGHVYRVEIT